MKMHIAPLALILTFGRTAAVTQEFDVPLSKLPSTMDDRGAPLSGTPSAILPSDQFSGLDGLPTARLSKVASEPVSELTAWARSAKGANLSCDFSISRSRHD